MQLLAHRLPLLPPSLPPLGSQHVCPGLRLLPSVRPHDWCGTLLCLLKSRLSAPPLRWPPPLPPLVPSAAPVHLRWPYLLLSCAPSFSCAPLCESPEHGTPILLPGPPPQARRCRCRASLRPRSPKPPPPIGSLRRFGQRSGLPAPPRCLRPPAGPPATTASRRPGRPTRGQAARACCSRCAWWRRRWVLRRTLRRRP